MNGLRQLLPSFVLPGDGPDSISAMVDQGLNRAAAGLIAAACAETTVCVVVARSGYPLWFLAVVFPLLVAATVVGIVQLLVKEHPQRWMAALCVLFAVFSLTATWVLRHQYTGGLNAAEPFIGLGAFGAGMSAGLWTRVAAAMLIALHRGALIVAGTGHPGEHELLALLECGSFIAAVGSSVVIRRYAGRLNETENALRDETEFDAESKTVNAAVKERNRLLHDAPVNRLWQVAHSAREVGSAEFRRSCAGDAELLRGRVPLFQREQDLAGGLKQLIDYFGPLGLKVRLTPDDPAHYPADPLVVTALTRAVEQALFNVMWHSGRDDAEVVVTAAPSLIAIQVRDHGRGLRPTPGGDGRLGVSRSISQRMRDVGGDATITEPGRGVMVRLWWPA